MNLRFLSYAIIPACLLVLPYVFHALLDGAPFYFNKESGAVENITALILAVALYVSVYTIFQLKSTYNCVAYKKPTTLWLMIYAAGCLYFLGEEISWGQHLFDWATPDGWLEVNDQHETNLHNTSALFDQVPRVLLTVGIIIGGFIMPLTQRTKAAPATPTLVRHVMPGTQCIVSAGTVLFISIHDKIYDLFGIDIPEFLSINDGEVKESLIAMFILVYICDARERWKDSTGTTS